MPEVWIEQEKIFQQLNTFFSENKEEIQAFGSTVNQTFEAFVFASVVNWYKTKNWSVQFKNPKNSPNCVKLKFSTRGQPNLYTYALCTRGEQVIQVRHGLRVATKHHKNELTFPANVVLDVAVISNQDLSKHKTDNHVENSCLITFGEAKHMSAFAELIANFIGLVHEMMPDKIRTIKLLEGTPAESEHPHPFLYVSGHLYPTAQGITETIKDRNLDIGVYDYITGSKLFGVDLPVKLVRRTRKSKKASETLPEAEAS